MLIRGKKTLLMDSLSPSMLKVARYMCQIQTDVNSVAPQSHLVSACEYICITILFFEHIFDYGMEG